MRDDAEVRELRDRIRLLEGQLAARGVGGSVGGGGSTAGCVAAGLAAVLVIAGAAGFFLFSAPSARGPDPMQRETQAQAEAEARRAVEAAALAEAQRAASEAARTAAGGDPLAATAYVDDDAVYDGRVVEASGASHLQVGDTCRVDLEWTTDPSRNCRALVDCGGRHVYGDVGQGWFTCYATADEGLRSGEDHFPTSQDGDPRFRVNRIQQIVQVSDDGPDWMLTLAISPQAEEENDGYEPGGER